MISETVVELSRWQFAITAMFHFLFVPLTLGLSVLLALMESLYVLTGLAVYQAACRLWGRLFAVSFVLGIATRLTMLFQFGMNGSYFSHYVGDVFALPLAIEALTAFFLASLLFGPYLFGWERLSKRQHLTIAWLIALSVNASAIWVLIANGWMQNPVGAVFNHQAFRMELTDFSQLLTNPVAAAKTVHTLAAAYVTAAATVLAISAWLLLRNQDDSLARNSFKIAAPLGLAAILLTAGLGDSTAHHDNPVQTRKLAALAGDDLSSLLPAIEARIRSGMKAYALLQELRDNNTSPEILAGFDQHKADLGYALLLHRWTEHPADASDKQIKMAAQYALPGSPILLYWAYRLMLACGILLMPLLLLAAWFGKGAKLPPSWLLRLTLYALPLPWLACIIGWLVAEAGQQPWAIAEILPTFLSVSSLSVKELSLSLAAYAVAYGALALFAWCRFRQILQTHLSSPMQGGLQ